MPSPASPGQHLDGTVSDEQFGSYAHAEGITAFGEGPIRCRDVAGAVAVRAKLAGEHWVRPGWESIRHCRSCPHRRFCWLRQSLRRADPCIACAEMLSAAAMGGPRWPLILMW